MRFVLGPWNWYTPVDDEPYWGAPKGVALHGCLDFRNYADMAAKGGTAKGYGVFALNDGAPDPGSEYRLLGTSLSATIKPADLAIIGSQLSVGTLISPTLDLLLYELATVKADPTHLTFARPWGVSMDRQVGIDLIGERVHYEVFDSGSIQHAAILKQIQEQYRKNKILSSTGYMAPDHYRRVLDFTQKKLGLPWEALIPPDMTGEPGPLKHRTIVPDDFNRGDEALKDSADWAALTGGLYIVGNRVVENTSSNGVMRNENDLSGADMSAKIDVNGGGDTTGDRRFDVYVRMLTTATSFTNLEAYWCRIDLEIDTIMLRKRVGGTTTTLDTNTDDAYGDSTTYEDKCEANASAIAGYIDSVSKVSASDSAVTGNLRHGINMDNDTSGVAYFDNYEAADLAVGGDTFIRRRKQLLNDPIPEY